MRQQFSLTQKYPTNGEHPLLQQPSPMLHVCYNFKPMDNERGMIAMLGNRYRLLRRIGVGGMAIVYHGRDLMLERPVAIKVLRQDLSSDPGFREHFKQEAKAAANLSHPNIVTVHDFGLDKNQLYIVMEYVPGNGIKNHHASKGTIPGRRGNLVD